MKQAANKREEEEKHSQWKKINVESNLVLEMKEENVSMTKH